MKWLSPTLLFPKGFSNVLLFLGGWGGGAFLPKSSGMVILENGSKGVFNMTPKQEGGWGVEWPIDPLSEGNICESFEYILLLRETGSVLP